MRLQVPKWIKRVWNKPIWSIVPNSHKTIYLTFDDGPHPEITPKILDILDEFDAKATFFCVGNNVRRNPTTFELIKERGHTVGNHTYDHIKGFSTENSLYLENVKKADKLIGSKLFRPPFGRITPRQIRMMLENNFKVVLWSFITYDYDCKMSVERIMKIIKKHSKDGAVVVFHDSKKAEKNVLQTLPLALQYWKKEGYVVKSIPQDI